MVTISTFLALVALISSANNNGVLKNLPWSIFTASGGGGDKDVFYVGIYEIGQQYNGNDDFWDQENFADCKEFL